MLAAAGAAQTHLFAAESGGEKSIVVDVATAADEGVALATDLAGGGLEPIAAGSDFQPDLAEEPLDPQSTGEPTLADEYLHVAGPPAPGSVEVAEESSVEATAEDVCEEEQVTPSGREALAAIQAASFNGATPGTTTRAELLRDWGQPVADAASGTALVFELPGFPAVTASLKSDVVVALRVELPQAASPEQLIDRLGLTGVRASVVADESGAPLTTTFPERGVTFIHATANDSALATDDAEATAIAADHTVPVIVLRASEAAPFVQRAETTEPRAYGCRIADLETALRLDAASAHARWLLSQAKLSVGLAIAAETLAREAVDLEPRNDDYRLQWAKCLKELARYDHAVAETRAILEGSTASPLTRAQALHHMGLLAALGDREVQQRAIPLQNKAIDLADSLAGDEDAAVRAAAHHVLVSAHLAVGERIAAGTWDNKQDFVGQWIARSSALSEQMIETGEGDVSLRLEVALTALAAGSKLEPPVEPAPWIEEAELAAAEVRKQVDDDLGRAQIAWRLGIAYLYATEIAHRRADVDGACKYGDLAVASLEAGKASRGELPDSEFVMGRLYFQIGAVHAVHKTDHVAACRWYDRAIEPLSQPAPLTALASPGLHSDALVSMAVSYWEIGDRERAYELTGAGVELVEQGIAEGLLSAEALTVPQSNFLAMSRALGKAELATPAAEAPTTEPQQVAGSDRSGRRSTARGAGPRGAMRTATRGTQRR
ncbi:MAG TPA: hypothetical protein VEQ85_04410 [Lacipirellulaceae bacterium]|nr:hypothetical protein [Lacipirellulaceae bacterium]